MPAQFVNNLRRRKVFRQFSINEFARKAQGVNFSSQRSPKNCFPSAKTRENWPKTRKDDDEKHIIDAFLPTIISLLPTGK